MTDTQSKTVVGRTRSFLLSIALIARPVGRACKMVWNTSRSGMVLMALQSVMRSVLPLLQMWLFKLIIDRISAAVTMARLGNHGLSPQTMLPVMLLVTTWIVTQILEITEQMTQVYVGEKLTLHVNDLIVEQASRLDLSYYEDPEYYDMLSKAQAEAGWRPMHVVHVIFQFAQNLILVTGMIAIIARLHWLIAVALFVTAIPRVITLFHFNNRRWAVSNSQAPTKRWLNYYRMMLTDRVAAKEMRLFGLMGHFLQNSRRLGKEICDENLRIFTSQSLASLWSGALYALTLGGVYSFAISRAAMGIISLGDLTLYFQASQRYGDSMLMLLYTWSNLHEHCLFLNNLFAYLEHEPRVQNSKRSNYNTTAPLSFKHSIELKNVSFRYPGAEKEVLSGISLQIKAGERVALVGENGAGKTTLVKLLCGLYPPSSGQVLIDGMDLQDVAIKEWWARIAVVLQDYICYQLTVRENIGFGDIAHLQDQLRITHAAVKGGAHSMITDLPQDYATLLGRQFDGAVDLSVGQWQKLSLSRAFMREEAQLLILDEPTSALDPRAENEVYERFADLTAGRTTVLISHRLSTVRMADRILVLVDGKLSESGSHDCLIAQSGTYADLYRMQADRYR